jgi:hypothetical protein
MVSRTASASSGAIPNPSRRPRGLGMVSRTQRTSEGAREVAGGTDAGRREAGSGSGGAVRKFGSGEGVREWRRCARFGSAEAVTKR